jgi:hypothetical protein
MEIISMFRMCGSNGAEPQARRMEDPRNMGFPLDQEWSGTNFMETISNRNR